MRGGGLSIVVGLLAWEVLGHLFRLPWLPPFSSVLVALADLVTGGPLVASLLVSLRALALGFGASLVIGLVVGSLMGRFRSINTALDVYVHALLFAPNIVLAPVFFALFGLSDITRLLVIIFYATFIIIANTAAGIRQMNPELVEMGRSFQASELRIFTRIMLPAALPLIFAGIRLGMGRGVKGMINGELLITLTGLGFLAERYGSQFKADYVLAVSLVVAIVALAAIKGVDLLEARLTRWAD